MCAPTKQRARIGFERHSAAVGRLRRRRPIKDGHSCIGFCAPVWTFSLKRTFWHVWAETGHFLALAKSAVGDSKRSQIAENKSRETCASVCLCVPVCVLAFARACARPGVRSDRIGRFRLTARDGLREEFRQATRAERPLQYLLY